MTEVTVDAEYLAALEKLADEGRRWNKDGSHSADRRLALVIEALPPAPEELIQMEGWAARLARNGSGTFIWAVWTTGDSEGGIGISGPTRETEAEAIAAGNAMLREIAAKVPR